MYIDSRERHDNSKDKNIIELFDQKNIPYELKMIDCGDYII